MKRNVFLGMMALCLALTVLLPVPSGICQKSPLSDSPYGVHIKENGSVYPSYAIKRVGNVYTLTGDIYFAIVIERDNITIDGAGYSLIGNEGGGPGLGRVDLHYRHGVTVKNLVVKNTHSAFDLTYADDNTLVGNTIINSGHAFYLWWSRRNNITGNTIEKAETAFEIFMSPNYGCDFNMFKGNTVLNSQEGIVLMESNNTFSDNIINSSSVGVSISGNQNIFRNNTITSSGTGFETSTYNNDIDESNLVNDKPIIYWIGHRHETIPSDAGFVLLSKCENIVVQNLQLSDVTLFSTTTSLIIGNTLSGGKQGIKMRESSNNTIIGNSLQHNSHGIELTNCHDNKIVYNNISDNGGTGMLLTDSHYNTINRNIVANNGYEGGIRLMSSSNNLVTENNVTGNDSWGMRVLGGQHDNLIYNNNFINNKVRDGLQVSMLGASMGKLANPSFWDNGTRGNYWSDYRTRYQNASEIDSTGIGNTPFYINTNNTDYYPLMKPVVIPEFPTIPLENTLLPVISFISPENTTYTVHNVPLTSTVDKQISWIGYSLDSQEYVTIIENVTLIDLSDGAHTIIVQVSDIFGIISSSSVYFTVDTIGPNVSILSAENRTYTTTEIPLEIKLDEKPSWMAYSLDGQANTPFTGNTTITGLSDGLHSLTVYAKDDVENVGTSETVYFTVTQKAEPFPVTWIAAIVVASAVVGASLLSYVRRQRTNGKAK